MRLRRLHQTNARVDFIMSESPKLVPLMLLTSLETRQPGQIFETDWHLFCAYINSNSLLLEHEQKAGKIVYEGFLDALGAMASKVGGGIKAAGQAVTDAAKKSAETLGNNLKAFTDVVGEKIDDIIAWAISSIPGGKAIYDFLTKAGAQIETFLNEVFKRAKDALADFAEKGRQLLVDKVIGLIAKDESVKNEIAMALGIDEPLIQKCGEEIEQAETSGEDPDGQSAESGTQAESYRIKKVIIRESALAGFDAFARKSLLGERISESRNIYSSLILERDLKEFFGFDDDADDDDADDDGIPDDEDDDDDNDGILDSDEEGEEEEGDEEEEEGEEGSACGVKDLFDDSSIPQFKPEKIYKKGAQGIKDAMTFAGTMQKMFTGNLTGGDLEAAARGALATVFEKVFDIWYKLGTKNAARYFEPLLKSELFQRFKSGFMTALGGIMGIAASVDLEFEKVKNYIQAIVEGSKAGNSETKTPDGKPYFETMMMENGAALLKDLLLGLIKGSNIENIVRGLVGDPTAIQRFIKTVMKSLKGAVKSFVQANKKDMLNKFFGQLPFSDIIIKNAEKIVDPIFAGIDKLLPD